LEDGQSMNDDEQYETFRVARIGEYWFVDGVSRAFKTEEQALKHAEKLWERKVGA